MNYRIVVICASEKRKKDTEDEFKFFDIKAPVVYFDASTPSNSSIYLDSARVDKSKLGGYCCGLSHMRALVDAAKDDAPEFTIIAEDDIAINEYFIPVIEEFINNWETYMGKDKVANLGWAPQAYYKYYLPKQSYLKLSSAFGHKVFNTMMPFGTQAYMVRKKDIIPFVRFFNHSTFDSFYNYLMSHDFPDINKTHTLIHCDYYIPRILGPRLVFPPVAIERQTQSIIQNIGINNESIWGNLFKDYETLRMEYYGNNIW